ncbi:MAG: RhuM family protein [Desulfobacterales bacterium]
MSKELVRSDRPDSGKGQFLVYETEDGKVKIDVRLEDETVWLTQKLMADLFQTTKQNISLHIQSVFEEGELAPEATVKKYLTVRREGKREVKRLLDYYNLDMIISVGYRVKSHVATRFRIWATQHLREYIVKGFVLDDERLKNPDQAMRRIPMHMADWIKKLDAFLTLNEREILNHAGRISHEMVKEMAETEYEKFNRRRIRQKIELYDRPGFQESARHVLHERPQGSDKRAQGTFCTNVPKDLNWLAKQPYIRASHHLVHLHHI